MSRAHYTSHIKVHGKFLCKTFKTLPLTLPFEDKFIKNHTQSYERNGNAN